MILKTTFLIALSIPLLANLEDLLQPVISKKSFDRYSNGSDSDKQTNKKIDSFEPHALLEDEINQLLTKALAEKFSPIGSFSANITQPWKTVMVRDKHWKFEMVQYPPGGLRSYFNARFKILSEGTVLGIWTVPVVCQIWQNVYRTTQSIPRESTLHPNSLETQSVNILKINQKTIPESFSLSTYETQKPLQAGKFLTWSDLQKKPLIRKGQVVDVYAKRGLMTIRAKGRSLEKGNIGQLISIKNISSNKYIQAEVIDENSVKVYF